MYVLSEWQKIKMKRKTRTRKKNKRIENSANGNGKIGKETRRISTSNDAGWCGQTKDEEYKIKKKQIELL